MKNMTEPINILVIDDSEDDRLLYRRAMQKSAIASYNITEAADGEEGISRIPQAKPACILLDYSMPGRNGVEVLKRIRVKHPFIPVVMLTGQGNEAVAVTAMQEGAQNYISKATISPESLERVILTAMENCALQKRIHEQRVSLEVFTRALAHDLKEPIHTIRSFLNLISNHEKLSETTTGYFNYIQSAADRMSALIDTVYFYTRLEAPDEHINKELCNAATVLSEAEDNLQELITERKATITSVPLPEIYVNKAQLIQVMQNLLTNAIRYSDAPVTIHIGLEEEAEHFLFKVTDNGPGIAREYLEKIFEPFKRFTRYEEHGSGLGLATCRKIVEIQGGKIWCESTPGSGATFLFTLPKPTPMAVDKDNAPANASLSEKPSGTNDKSLASIMLVDDNPADIVLSRILLVKNAHLHCNLLTASDGREALGKLRDGMEKNNPVDLMLLDVNMPGMDGFELLEEMRTNENLKRTAVVMCTTSIYDKDVERAKMLGTAGYLTKPADFGKLKTIIEGVRTLQLSPEGEGYALLRNA